MKLHLTRAICCCAALCLVLTGLTAVTASARDFRGGNNDVSLFSGDTDVTLGTLTAQGQTSDYTSSAQDMFQWRSRIYVRWTASPHGAVTQDQVGKLLTTIDHAENKSLLGCSVYWYNPTNCEAVVAVAREGRYDLYRYYGYTFYQESENDAKSFLRMGGIYNLSDLARIDFYAYDQRNTAYLANTVSQPEDLKVFHNFFIQLRDSSKDYYDALEDYEDDEDDDNKSTTKTLQEMNGSNSVKTYAVTGAWYDRKTVRVYGTNGIYMELDYYPRLEYMGRFDISGALLPYMQKWGDKILWPHD